MPKRVNDEINVASGNKRRREKVAADVPGASAQVDANALLTMFYSMPNCVLTSLLA